MSTTSLPRSRTARAAALVLPLAMAGVLGITAQPAQAEQSDSTTTCLRRGTDPAALVRAQAETVVNAPLPAVWKLFSDVRKWPAWHQGVLSMKRLDPGPLRPGSRFRWTAPAPATPSTPATTLEITSTVRQIKPGSCIRWNGPAIGEGVRIDNGVHVWTFTKVDTGVLVRTEETWTGDQVEADVPGSAALLRGGLQQWLLDLKSTAEGQVRPQR